MHELDVSIYKIEVDDLMHSDVKLMRQLAGALYTGLKVNSR